MYLFFIYFLQAVGPRREAAPRRARARERLREGLDGAARCRRRGRRGDLRAAPRGPRRPGGSNSELDRIFI